MEVTLSEQPPVIQDRFNRTVCRIAAEAFWLRTYQAAIEGMRVEAIGLGGDLELTLRIGSN